MDNPSRSERSRNAAIQAALTIIARDGPGKLTFEALSRESGISKGGLMHQFRTKVDVLKALLQHQSDHLEKFSQDYQAALAPAKAEPALAAQIATLREATAQSQSVALAIVAALIEAPDLLEGNRELAARHAKTIQAEAADPDLSMLRWEAALGLTLSQLFGISPLSEKERDRLFECLLDDERWTAHAAVPKAPRGRKPGVGD
ncbi:TetR/AcrR family transcriptional regulator [Trinickia terrae]|uniref:TetR/AcrR family transcriptional regulator n=1 Tax=Trinickia terrae TaxID=2571161 RepID=A0A4U1HQ32_9BURK|nr:TetR/AcrR family transcriptional regulator [Trinickia terrae]TKC81624.1 TetR/AcrR family transcriptional regulator [Trinickia terrae]